MRSFLSFQVPQGKTRIMVQMATTVNIFVTDKKRKLPAAKENSLLCDTCFAKAQHRMFWDKSSTVHSSDQELTMS